MPTFSALKVNKRNPFAENSAAIISKIEPTTNPDFAKACGRASIPVPATVLVKLMTQDIKDADPPNQIRLLLLLLLVLLLLLLLFLSLLQLILLLLLDPVIAMHSFFFFIGDDGSETLLSILKSLRLLSYCLVNLLPCIFINRMVYVVCCPCNVGIEM